MTKLHITAVLNLHREGVLAHPSLLSLRKAKARAERQGLQVEVVIVLDRPDQPTLDMVANHDTKQFRNVIIDAGDLGQARNSGVRAARGEWIAFLDGDDLWGENWLSAAKTAADVEARETIWHPEVSVYFGEQPQLIHHVDMDSGEFNPLFLLLHNYWTSLCFARRSLLLEVPYPKSSLSDQIGFEDWGWNMQTIANGAVHKIVPGTGHAIRIRRNSLLRQANAANCLPSPSDLYRQILEAKPKSSLKQK